MASVLSMRNWIYWWVFLTSFIFLAQPARDAARNFRSSSFFSVNVFPFNLAETFTRWLDDRSQQIVSAFQFDPNVVVVKVQNFLILDGNRVGFLLIAILVILAIRSYMRAVASPLIYDDILALVICFFVYYLVAETLHAIRFAPNAQGVTLGKQLIALRSNAVFLLALIILAMVLNGKGWFDAKVFWKGLFELFFTWLFLIPDDATRAFAALLEALANFGSGLALPSNGFWALVWASLGMLLAIARLYNAQPAGGGGGAKPAAKPAGGGGGGGFLKRLGGK